MPTLDDIARLRPMVASIWLGMLIGVSFLATPVKFQAADLDLPTALDIGRLTFRAFSRVEWVLAVALVVTVLAARPSRGRRIAAAVAVAGLAVQAVWLLPVLSARVATIVSGGVPEAAPHHALYASLKVTKALALGVLGLPARSARPDRRIAAPDEEWQSNAM